MRYARALFEVSRKDGDLDRVEREVSAFLNLMDKSQELRRSLLGPAVSPPRKKALIGALLSRVDDFSEISVRLLTLLAERDRLSILSKILENYRNQLRQERGVVQACITTESRLPAEQVRAIAKRLETVTGKRISIEARVDTALMGGIVTQIGSTVYDGSIVGHLERLRKEFLHEA